MRTLFDLFLTINGCGTSNYCSVCSFQEVLVKGLAESRAFQRFAVRTQSQVDGAKKMGTEYMTQTVEQFEKMSVEEAAKAGPPPPPLRGVPGFFSAFSKEVRKDLGAGS